jgi:hypothetical protein
MEAAGFLWFWFRMLWVIATAYVIVPIGFVIIALQIVASLRARPRRSPRGLVRSLVIVLGCVAIAAGSAWSLGTLGAVP